MNTAMLSVFRFISAENLHEILGDDFSREEIDGIISEATGGKHDKISYSEFLKLWEEKKENERVESPGKKQ